MGPSIIVWTDPQVYIDLRKCLGWVFRRVQKFWSQKISVAGVLWVGLDDIFWTLFVFTNVDVTHKRILTTGV